VVANGDTPLLCFFDDLRDNAVGPVAVGQMQQWIVSEVSSNASSAGFRP